MEFNLQPAAVSSAINSINVEKGRTLLALRNDLKRSSMRHSKKTGMRSSNLTNDNRKMHKGIKTKRANALQVTGRYTNKAISDQWPTDSSIKVKFNEMAEGELKELTVFIDPTMRHRFGRRTTLVEALLGVSVCPFPNSNRIMIAGYMRSSEISQAKVIKIGDWLKSINGQEINVENIELILLSYTQPTYIKLQLRRIAVEEPPPSLMMNVYKTTNTGEFVETLQTLFGAKKDDAGNFPMIFNVLIITLKENDKLRLGAEDVIFCYPPVENNGKLELSQSESKLFFSLNMILFNGSQVFIVYAAFF